MPRFIAGGEDSFTAFKAPQVSSRDLAKGLSRVLQRRGRPGVDPGRRRWLHSRISEAGIDGARHECRSHRRSDPPIVPGYQRIVWQRRTSDIIVASARPRRGEAIRRFGGGEGKRYCGPRRKRIPRGEPRGADPPGPRHQGAVAGDLRPVIGATDRGSRRQAPRRPVPPAAERSDREALDRDRAFATVLINGEILRPRNATARPSRDCCVTGAHLRSDSPTRRELRELPRSSSPSVNCSTEPRSADESTNK